MLLEHNINVYNELTQTLSEQNCCCVVMGTGCGKTYVATEYLDENNYKALVVSPRRSICESWEKHTPRVETITYQKLARIYKEIDFSVYDVVICDEVHHIGAPTWGAPIKYLIDNKIVKVIGLTESSVRYTDGGKDVAEDFFYGNIALGENVPSAIEKKILNPVTYVGAMFNSDGLKKTLRGKIQSRLYAKLNLALNKTPTVEEILKKHMPAGKRKGIIFASTIEDIKSAMEFVKSVYPNTTIKFVHSKQSQSYNDEAFDWFKQTDEGYICSVDMISEGVHIKGVNTLIMLRRTESVNLFNQQLGRCLSANSEEPAILFDLVNNKYSIRIINDKLKIRTNSIFSTAKLNIAPSEQLIVNDYTKDIVDVLQEIKLSLETRWTEKEDDLLKKFYEGSFGDINLTKFVEKYLTSRTVYAARYRANYLKLTNYLKYSDEEIEIIKKYYPTEGTKCSKMLNNRSVSSIHIMAKKLGIKFINPLTDEEIEIIKKHYEKEGKDITKRINKPLASIQYKANELGLYSQAYRASWTEEEDNLIKENYYILGAKKLQKLLPKKRTQKSIIARAQKLNIRKRRNKILCVETNKIYESAEKACKDINRNSPSKITMCCNGKRQSAYGYHWKYVEEE